MRGKGSFGCFFCLFWISKEVVVWSDGLFLWLGNEKIYYFLVVVVFVKVKVL